MPPWVAGPRASSAKISASPVALMELNACSSARPEDGTSATSMIPACPRFYTPSTPSAYTSQPTLSGASGEIQKWTPTISGRPAAAPPAGHG